jgi:hypothetical protein
MPNYKGGQEVPTGAHDPKPEFFAAGTGKQANCYAFAVNLLNSDSPSLHPGQIASPADSSKWATGQGPTIDEYRAACELDKLRYLGTDITTAASYSHGRTDGFVMMLEKVGPGGDFHAARMDSNGNWCEKYADATPYLADGDQPGHRIGIKRYFWVDPSVVKLTAVVASSRASSGSSSGSKDGCCIIC